GEPVLRIFVAGADGVEKELPPEQIYVTDLSSFAPPPASLPYFRRGDNLPTALPIAVALDPELGRLCFPAAAVPTAVWTSYHYGFSTELGGGGYDRPARAAAAGETWVTVKSGDSAQTLSRLVAPTDPGSLWSGAGAQLTVEIADSDTYPLRSL